MKWNTQQTINVQIKAHSPVSKLSFWLDDPDMQSENGIKMINIMQQNIWYFFYFFCIWNIIPTCFSAVFWSTKAEAAVVVFAWISHWCNIFQSFIYSIMLCEVGCQTVVIEFVKGWWFYFLWKNKKKQTNKHISFINKNYMCLKQMKMSKLHFVKCN